MSARPSPNTARPSIHTARASSGTATPTFMLLRNLIDAQSNLAALKMAKCQGVVETREEIGAHGYSRHVRIDDRIASLQKIADDAAAEYLASAGDQS